MHHIAKIIQETLTALKRKKKQFVRKGGLSGKQNVEQRLRDLLVEYKALQFQNTSDQLWILTLVMLPNWSLGL